MKVARLRKLPDLLGCVLRDYSTPASAASSASTSTPMSLPSVPALAPGETLLQPDSLAWQRRGSLATPFLNSRTPAASAEETTMVPLGQPPFSPMMRFFSNFQLTKQALRTASAPARCESWAQLAWPPPVEAN